MDWGTTIGVAGVVIGIVSIVVALVLHGVGVKKKDLCWAIRTNNLISDYSSALSGLRVEYHGEAVANLSVSNVVIWNNGREVIDERDLETGIDHHLSLVAVGDARIMNVELLEENKSANAVQMFPSINQQSALLNFRYLGHQHGAVFQVVHTGKSSDDLDLVGEVRGVDAVNKKLATRRSFVNPNMAFPKILWMIPAVFVASIGLAYLGFRPQALGFDASYAFVFAALGGLCASVALTPVIPSIQWWRRRLPSGLDSFVQISIEIDRNSS